MRVTDALGLGGYACHRGAAVGRSQGSGAGVAVACGLGYLSAAPLGLCSDWVLFWNGGGGEVGVDGGRNCVASCVWM